MRLPAAEDERFAPAVAESLIGKRLKLNQRTNEGGRIVCDYGWATILAAEVTDDGERSCSPSTAMSVWSCSRSCWAPRRLPTRGPT